MVDRRIEREREKDGQNDRTHDRWNTMIKWTKMSSSPLYLIHILNIWRVSFNRRFVRASSNFPWDRRDQKTSSFILWPCSFFHVFCLSLYPSISRSILLSLSPIISPICQMIKFVLCLCACDTLFDLTLDKWPCTLLLVDNESHSIWSVSLTVWLTRLTLNQNKQNSDRRRHWSFSLSPYHRITVCPSGRHSAHRFLSHQTYAIYLIR